ncbi:MAG: glycosyltransferase family 2 protein [Bacteroidota bacterium]|nr:glycosyltransferase family 2 protein [Bacteroidota bacterium]
MDSNLNTHIPAVSVVMSVYNGGNYLQEAIESILKQRFIDFEFIIINDGSTDASENIIKLFNDGRIVYVNNESNIGLIDSLNKGLKIAKGKYIARMDADDIALDDRLELQVQKFIENPKAIVVGSDYYLLSGTKLSYIKNTNDSDYNKAVLFFSPCFCHPTVMMKNVFNEKNIFYDREYKHAEDYKLWTDLFALGEFLNVDRALLKYRSHDTQISNKNKEAQLQISNKIRRGFCKKLNFSLSEEQFTTLNLIGNNSFIKSIDELIKIENCLLELKSQNEIHKVFRVISFNVFLHKFWSDSCGNSNIGLAAYSIYTKSVLSKVTNVTLDQKSKLLAKCLLRKFRTN